MITYVEFNKNCTPNCPNQTHVEYWDDKIDWTKYRYNLYSIY